MEENLWYSLSPMMDEPLNLAILVTGIPKKLFALANSVESKLWHLCRQL
jgi:hypothetical protein